MAAFSAQSALLPIPAWDWSGATRYFRYEVVRHDGAVWFLTSVSSIGETPGGAGPWRMLGWVSDTALPDVGEPGAFGAPDRAVAIQTDAKGRVLSSADAPIQISIPQVTGLEAALSGLATGFTIRQEVLAADGAKRSFPLIATPLGGVLLACTVSGMGRTPGDDYTLSGSTLDLGWAPESGEKIVVSYLSL